MPPSAGEAWRVLATAGRRMVQGALAYGIPSIAWSNFLTEPMPADAGSASGFERPQSAQAIAAQPMVFGGRRGDGSPSRERVRHARDLVAVTWSWPFSARWSILSV